MTETMQRDFISDNTELNISTQIGAKILTLKECVDRQLLISPDSGAQLHLDELTDRLFTGSEVFEIVDGSPRLYPSIVLNKLENGSLPLKYDYDSVSQYVLLSQIKQSTGVNAVADSVPARILHYRTAIACQNLQGSVLDIGSDRPSHSAKLLPEACDYVGLDPYLGSGEFRLLGLGEILPIRSNSIDNILFNTSLDHILDYMTALDEAWRVLKPGGKLVINTYAWLTNATLLSDNVHFHHFREYQVLGALDKFAINRIWRYVCPKNNTHRYTLVVLAEKTFHE
jgi:SAM-dependent methyltransferase